VVSLVDGRAVSRLTAQAKLGRTISDGAPHSTVPAPQKESETRMAFAAKRGEATVAFLQVHTPASPSHASDDSSAHAFAGSERRRAKTCALTA
jgi:hypothetical protein